MTIPLPQIQNSIANSESYDLSRWGAPIINHQENEEAGSTWDQDGIHRVCTGTGTTIDIYLQDYGLLRQIKQAEERVLLVGFTGALTMRNGKPGPFFSGIKVAKRLKLPLLAVADPTISKCEELIISWYAGNEDVVNASEIIGRWLDKLAHYYKARLLLFGGSAGGFGALSVLPYLTSQADCLVWNPQTSIARYMPKFVLHYLKHGFAKKFARIDTKAAVTREDLRGFLEETGVRHDLQSNYRIPENVNLLFVQNNSDWHVKSHALPFLRNLKVYDDSEELIDRNHGNISVRVGNFGRGHIAPNKNTINACLKYLMDPEKNAIDASIFNSFLVNSPDNNGKVASSNSRSSQQGGLFPSTDDFEISARQEGRTIVAQIDIRPGVFISPTFAFYFLKEGKRKKIRSYNADNTATFEDTGESDFLYVVGFVADDGIRIFKKVRVNTRA
ncbi:hypothetical protein W822_04190 [Advenella kashmirensis W13003]|uniref:Alpha/beta hydrolase n=1 Tax=Advenella kashmirensis W13003 TaxID=1424334 RepID=V8QYJ8_9BURK|nr:hypothetical protein [Advenella kashmirensis]ETF04722.1 hypothetical protein W822_04190 [Advenella kashmirensis W13003]